MNAYGNNNSYNRSVLRLRIRALENRLENLQGTGNGRLKRRERLGRQIQHWRVLLVHWTLLG